MNVTKKSLGERIIQSGGTLAVLVLLGGIAFWGHRTGWKAPRFSQLWLKSDPGPKEDWCETHNVPKSRCIACNPELGGADKKDWCKEHGVPESKCTVCHPEILTKGVAADWCKEHSIPESQCTLCHPEIAVKGQAPKDEVTVTAAPDQKAPKNPGACQTHLMRVQFASSEAVQKAGVKVGAVLERPMAAYLQTSAETSYDQGRVARLSARVPGSLFQVLKEVGQPVTRGEILALVDAAEVGRAKAEFLQATALLDVKTKTYARLKASAENGFRTQAELQEAEAVLREAKIRLIGAEQALENLGLSLPKGGFPGISDEELARRVKTLGIPELIATRLEEGTPTANLIPLGAPFDGTVTAREGVAGELVEPSKTLYVIADTRRLWVMGDVRLEDAAKLALGQEVLFRPDGSPEDAATGKVSWLSTAVDEKTRTVRLRAEIENPEGRLRAQTFGMARIKIREAPKAVAVPTEAIQWEGCCHIVFVRLTDEIFQTRKVRLGARNGAYTEVEVGVLPGEVVVTEGSHVLKSDILRSALGGSDDD